jgi:hypothetical protein
MKTVPDVVLVKTGDLIRKGLVISARMSEAAHLGKDGEPLISVVVVKPRQNPADLELAHNKRAAEIQNATSHAEVEILHDVVHASHEFPQSYKEKHGLFTPAQILTHRGHAEWAEEFRACSFEPDLTA